MESLLKRRAIVLRLSELLTDRGIRPDFRARLCEEALRIRVVSSAGERSAIDRKCRGANGDVGVE